MLSRYRDDREIVLVELHNEVRPNDHNAIAWVRAMLPYLSKVLPGTILEQAQAAYYRGVFAAAAEVGLPDPAAWILNDFRSGAIPPGRTASGRRSYDYGLFRVDGTPKPAAKIVAVAFGGRM